MIWEGETLCHVFYIPLNVVSVCIQKFKKDGLVAHEVEINQLQDKGDHLVEMKHPGSPTIKVHLSAMADIRNIWSLN